MTNDAPETFPVGTTTVTWTATDVAGNVGTATQTVTITMYDNDSSRGDNGIHLGNDKEDNHQNNGLHKSEGKEKIDHKRKK